MFIIRQIYSPMFLSHYEIGLVRISFDQDDAKKMSQDEANKILNLLENSPVTRGMYRLETVKN